MAATIHWDRLNESAKSEIRVHIMNGNGSALIQSLRRHGVLHNGGCGCNVTPKKVLYLAQLALKQQRI